MTEDRRSPRRRMSWANAYAVADQHAMELISIESEAFAATARALQRNEATQQQENPYA